MRIVKPGDHVMSGIDLKVVALTSSSLIFPAPRHFQFTASLAMTVAGGPGTTGLANWNVDVYADEGGSELIHTIVGVTDISTKVDGTWGVFTFGGAGTGRHNGTLDPSANTLKVLPFVRIGLNVTEVSDATTATGDVHLLVEEFGGGSK